MTNHLSLGEPFDNDDLENHPLVGDLWKKLSAKFPEPIERHETPEFKNMREDVVMGMFIILMDDESPVDDILENAQQFVESIQIDAIREDARTILEVLDKDSLQQLITLDKMDQSGELN